MFPRDPKEKIEYSNYKPVLVVSHFILVTNGGLLGVLFSISHIFSAISSENQYSQYPIYVILENKLSCFKEQNRQNWGIMINTDVQLLYAHHKP